ncbi:hypothetical protein PSE10A_06730 [Pseudomonas amygdali pv. eriobotryae]|uniref:Uncharacterized protein n=1 Tax=Pseudomonas amygdali pv. eriobotryae TaxID=129137 RepID=A0A9P3EB63_PSEA0|nr:hypothetical protein PSE10A_06730 [Pseudomonas amygdali pv. eriobotryae]
MSIIKKGIDLSHFQGDIDFKKFLMLVLSMPLSRQQKALPYRTKNTPRIVLTLEPSELERGHIITFVRSVARRKHNEIT